MGLFCSGYCGTVFNAWFDSVRPETDHVWFVTLKGETPLTWKWLITSRLPYQRMNVYWERWDDEKTDRGSLTVKLPSMEYSSAGTTGVLSQALLSSWLTGHPVPEGGKSNQDVEAVFHCIQAAANGTLPRPRHHTYSPSDGGRHRMQHFLDGLQFPLLPILGWIVVWYLLWGPRRKRTKPVIES